MDDYPEDSDEIFNPYRVSSSSYRRSQFIEQDREVHEDFRSHPIEISIAVENMPRTVRLLNSGKFYATISVKDAGAEEYRRILKTETREFDTFPYYVRKAWLPPMNMTYSLDIAKLTLLQVQLHAGRSRLSTAMTTLDSLLQARGLRLKCTLERRRLFSPYHPVILLSAESYLSQAGIDACQLYAKTPLQLDMHVPDPMIVLHVSTARVLRKSACGKELNYAVDRTNRLGDWTIVHRSRGAPAGAGNEHGEVSFPPCPLFRSTLLAGDNTRQIRLALYSSDTREGNRLEGFSIMRLRDLDRIREKSGGRAANLTWTRLKNSTMYAGLEFRSMETEDDGTTSITFLLKHNDQVIAEQIASDAELSRSQSTLDSANQELLTEHVTWSASDGFSPFSSQSPEATSSNSPLSMSRNHTADSSRTPELDDGMDLTQLASHDSDGSPVSAQVSSMRANRTDRRSDSVRGLDQQQLQASFGARSSQQASSSSTGRVRTIYLPEVVPAVEGHKLWRRRSRQPAPLMDVQFPGELSPDGDDAQ